MLKSRRVAAAQDPCRRRLESNQLVLCEESAKTTDKAAPRRRGLVDKGEEEEAEKSVLLLRGPSSGDDDYGCSEGPSSFCSPPSQAGKELASSVRTFFSSRLQKLPGTSYLRSHCNLFKRKCINSLKGGVTCFYLGFSVRDENNGLAAIAAYLFELGIHVRVPTLRSHRSFSLQDLTKATSQFGTDNLLRKGSSGSVYRGLLASTGEIIAVKVLNTRLKDARLSFGRELEMMYHVHHDHVQPLLGYCIEDGNLLLVYTYMSKGSVDHWLHTDVSTGEMKQCKLTWDVRYKVILGLAKALHYLHTECNPPIVHRDIKPSNILLTSCNEAKLADFGLALKASSPYLICEEVMGTFGYLSPEYFQYGKVSTKMDVYSFGIVLLELLTGRYPIGHANLANWARHLVIDSHDFTFQMADPLLGNSFSLTQMRKLLSIGVLCIHPLDSCRPTSSKVLCLIKEEPAESLQNLVYEAYQGASSTVNCLPVLPSIDKAIKKCDADLRKQYLRTAMQDVDS